MSPHHGMLAQAEISCMFGIWGLIIILRIVELVAGLPFLWHILATIMRGKAYHVTISLVIYQYCNLLSFQFLIWTSDSKAEYHDTDYINIFYPLNLLNHMVKTQERQFCFTTFIIVILLQWMKWFTAIKASFHNLSETLQISNFLFCFYSW